jgi:hypothetical protein
MGGLTQYGFEYGPMVVERIAHDERIGWVVTVRPRDAYKPRVDIRVSPKGRTWRVHAVECDSVKQTLWTSGDGVPAETWAS